MRNAMTFQTPHLLVVDNGAPIRVNTWIEVEIHLLREMFSELDEAKRFGMRPGLFLLGDHSSRNISFIPDLNISVRKKSAEAVWSDARYISARLNKQIEIATHEGKLYSTGADLRKSSITADWIRFDDDPPADPIQRAYALMLELNEIFQQNPGLDDQLGVRLVIDPDDGE